MGLGRRRYCRSCPWFDHAALPPVLRPRGDAARSGLPSGATNRACMANAREPFDAGTFSVYGLPLSPHYDTPTIYFQPAFLFLGGVAYATGPRSSAWFTWPAGSCGAS